MYKVMQHHQQRVHRWGTSLVRSLGVQNKYDQLSAYAVDVMTWTTLIWERIIAYELCDGTGERSTCEGKPCYTIDHCKDRCGQDPNCKSFMVEVDPCADEANPQCGQPKERTAKDGTPIYASCTFYKNNYPYQVYTLRRTQTSMKADAPEGATELQIESHEVFSVGDDITIGDVVTFDEQADLAYFTLPYQENTIEWKGLSPSANMLVIRLKNPLGMSVAKGAKITKVFKDGGRSTWLRKKFEGPLYPPSRLFARPGINTLRISKDDPSYLAGPLSDASLVLVTCQDRCIEDPHCNAIGFPGCYLLNLTTTPDSQPDMVDAHVKIANVEGISMLYVKQRESAFVDGMVGYPKVATFQSEEGSEQQGKQEARLAYLNRPTTCTFDSEGNLLIADTWNQRIRKVTDAYGDCHYHTDMNTKADIQDYINKTKEVEEKCGKSTAGVNKTYNEAQDAVLRYSNADVEATREKHLDTFEALLCDYSSKNIRWFKDLKSDYTLNLYVICNVCAIQATQGEQGKMCPEKELCECRAAIQNLLKTSVYLNCPKSHARYDKWHKFLSAYVRCLWKPEVGELDWLLDADNRTRLMDKLADKLDGGTS